MWRDLDLVPPGCQEEMARFRQMGFYENVKREDIQGDPDVEFIDIRWVKVNKGFGGTDPHDDLSA